MNDKNYYIFHSENFSPQAGTTFKELAPKMSAGLKSSAFTSFMSFWLCPSQF